MSLSRTVSEIQRLQFKIANFPSHPRVFNFPGVGVANWNWVPTQEVKKLE